MDDNKRVTSYKPISVLLLYHLICNHNINRTSSFYFIRACGMPVIIIFVRKFKTHLAAVCWPIYTKMDEVGFCNRTLRAWIWFSVVSYERKTHANYTIYPKQRKQTCVFYSLNLCYPQHTHALDLHSILQHTQFTKVIIIYVRLMVMRMCSSDMINRVAGNCLDQFNNFWFFVLFVYTFCTWFWIVDCLAPCCF